MHLHKMQNSDSRSSPSLQTNDPATIDYWDSIGLDPTELILSRLPISSIIRASCVCKFWNSVTHSHSFKSRVSILKTLPWLFICGQQNILPINTSVTFALDPESHEWIKLQGKGKPVNNTTSQHESAPLRFSWRDPLTSFHNNLVDMKIIHNPFFDFFSLCPPLPEVFIHGNSSKLLCSAAFQGKLYAFGIHSSFISCLDLETCSWSNVRTLRPPGALYSYLIPCKDRLVLAAICSINDEPGFNLWEINERTLEFREIGIMPEELAYCFFGNEEERRFRSLECVGSGDVVYVFSQEKDGNCPVCVCEITSVGECSWRSVPNLPETVVKCQQIIGFCSNVTLYDIFGRD